MHHRTKQAISTSTTKEMRLSRNPTEQEWAEIVALGPGLRMYRDKKTLFYNGEIVLRDEVERSSWKVIIVLPGVEVIP